MDSVDMDSKVTVPEADAKLKITCIKQQQQNTMY